ncbi:MAG TPA: hypothetical protein DCM32_10080, partial [Xanthomonadaceae bacterium]|nr:hypothetical protein [Xanthomonadaceae bacterium]
FPYTTLFRSTIEAGVGAGDAAAAPGEVEALRAAALQQLGQHAAAIEAYTGALRRQPDVGAWWAGLGLSLEAAGRRDEALAAYRDALRRGPLDPALADYLGDRIDALAAADSPRP